MPMESGAVTGAKTDVENDFALPPQCKVIMFNDDYTTMDFVVFVLKTIFHKNEADANALMELVHKTGSAIVGVYTYDIAVSRANLATSLARKNKFPLKVEVEIQ